LYDSAFSWPLLVGTMPIIGQQANFWLSLPLQVVLVLAPRLMVLVAQRFNLGFQAHATNKAQGRNALQRGSLERAQRLSEVDLARYLPANSSPVPLVDPTVPLAETTNSVRSRASRYSSRRENSVRSGREASRSGSGGGLLPSADEGAAHETSRNQFESLAVPAEDGAGDVSEADESMEESLNMRSSALFDDNHEAQHHILGGRMRASRIGPHPTITEAMSTPPTIAEEASHEREASNASPVSDGRVSPSGVRARMVSDTM